MSDYALSDIRILDLTRLLPGGFCTLLLADLGAEVLKVEDTDTGDYLRWAPPHYSGAHKSSSSALYLALNRNKRSIRIDLKREEGKKVFLKLVKTHDVLIESFRPGVLKRLNLGYENLKEINPKLIYCALSGYGQTGSRAGRAGHDLNYLAYTGLLGLTGERDGPPVIPAGQIADIGEGALMAVVGILVALHERQRSGEGQFLDISMSDGTLPWLALEAARYFCDGKVPNRGELDLAGKLICYSTYRCKDGWITLAALEPKFWQRWCQGVDREDLIEHHLADVGTHAHEELIAIFSTRTRAEWERFGRQYDCCLEPVLELDEALDSEQVRERNLITEIPQPGVAQPIQQIACPLKFSRTTLDRKQPAPDLGEHTDAVLEELGFSSSAITDLHQSGAVASVNDTTAAFLRDSRDANR